VGIPSYKAPILERVPDNMNIHDKKRPLPKGKAPLNLDYDQWHVLLGHKDLTEALLSADSDDGDG
jgi:hypothetical protein